MKPNRYMPFLSACLLSAGMAFGQDAAILPRFTGDTLNGFDMKACIAQATGLHLTAGELNREVGRQQAAFVRKKYHLAEPHRTASLGFPSVLSGSCNNLGFETGDFTGWSGGIGFDSINTRGLNVVSASINSMGIHSPETSCSYHTVVDSLSGNDPNTGLPMIAPQGGTYSVRLGGENINVNNLGTCPAADPNTGQSYSSGEYIQQTIPVTLSNCLIVYKYQVILSAAAHLPAESDYFRVEVLDHSGLQIPGCQYFVAADSATPPAGFVSGNGVSGTLYYCHWSQNSINLKPYIGQTVTVRFTAAGCVYGGHFAYAYLDASCSPATVTGSAPAACTGSTLTLTAPGAGSSGTYQWSTLPSGTAGITGSTTGQSAVINANGTYEVVVTQSPGNSFTIDTTITFYPNPTATITSTNASCGTCADGSATATPTGGNAPFSYSWWPAPGAGQGTRFITACLPGTYTCTIITANGCSTTATATINFSSGILSKAGSPAFSVSPNPFGNSLRIELGGDVKSADLMLYDVVGKEVVHQILGAGSQELNTADLSPGVYLVSLKSAKGNLIRRIIKQ